MLLADGPAHLSRPERAVPVGLLRVLRDMGEGGGMISIPMPEWFKFLSGREKMECLNDLDSGKEIVVDVDYDDNGFIKSAKLVRDEAK